MVCGSYKLRNALGTPSAVVRQLPAMSVLMYSTLLVSVFASVPQAVPDVGPSGLLLGLGILSLGLVAKFVKSRRK